MRVVFVAVVVGLIAGMAPADEAESDVAFAMSLRPPAAGDRFKRPVAVTADPHTGEIFVVDSRDHRIVIFDPDGLFRFQITGGRTFRAPLDVAVDPEGFLFLVASAANSRSILLLDFDGLLIKRIDLSAVKERTERLPEIISIALSLDGQRLFALDKANQALWILTREGGFLGWVDLAADLTEEEKEEQILGHVDVYGDTVLVANPTSGRVLLYDLDGETLGLVGLKGSGPRQSGFPLAGALDAEGNVWMLDQQRAMFHRWNPDGNRYLGEYFGIGRSPGALYVPLDLTLDRQGRVYVSQGFEGRVQVYEGAPPAAGTPEPAAPTEP